ncbi:inositol monophosphatase [Mechercharimyces sp. CAU 1602]|uniref:inositol monophosphatase family protein n=1 Tax=Mechercharimyces sp. CAU 1602 TaxID=2973933 RepID=UPI0021639277|nr:inositol monophosphatase [Mechercharimyces sp. CAU 1602]MCS1351812.1 inositol monophosphatase [Mechercharimyces sp. CAU 1602]
MEAILEKARKVAMVAATEAGKIAKERFVGSFSIVEKGEDGDVVTEVDLLAEEVILHYLRQYFPTHQIESEEAGMIGEEGEWLWQVDPLDGTNNFAIGLPLYGVCIALLHHDEPVMSVIYDSHRAQLYWAVRNQGAFCDGVQLRIPTHPPVPFHRQTISWIQGHMVQNDPEAAQLRRHLENDFKRVLRLWAPAIAWSMLARGDLGGVILYNSEGTDLYAGLLLAKEAGIVITDYDGQPLSTLHKVSEPYLTACHPMHLDKWVDWLDQVRGRE